MCDVLALQGPVPAVIQVDRLLSLHKAKRSVCQVQIPSNFGHLIPLTCFFSAIVHADAVAPVQSVGLDLRICFTGIVLSFV